MADLRINFAGNQVAESVLAGLGAAGELRRAGSPRVRSRLGRRGLEDDRRARAQRLESLRRLALRRPEDARDQQRRAHLRSPARSQSAEIAEVKRAWPDRAVIVSAMVESKPEAWHDIIRRIEDTGADGIELNYGCPHGMSERGMGAAVGQVPEYCEQITRWVMEVAQHSRDREADAERHEHCRTRRARPSPPARMRSR